MAKWDDERPHPAPPVEERIRPGRAKKDRRRWCRGKVGIEHTTAIRDKNPRWRYNEQICGNPKHLRLFGWICYEQEYCTECGKILRHTLGKDCTKR